MDILSINETKLENAYGNEVHVPGYEIIRGDRITVFYATNSINVIIHIAFICMAWETCAWKFKGPDQNRL